MTETFETPVAGDLSILAGAEVALRYNFIPHAHWYGDAQTTSPASWLDLVHTQIESSPLAAQYVAPLASFYADVTVPFTRRQQLPVGAMVEPISDWQQHPQLVEIEIDGFETLWEGHVAVVPPTRIMARFRDTVTLFESGHFVYAPSFLLQSAPNGHGAGLNPLHVSALTSLVSSPSAGYGQSHDNIRSQISFRFPGAAQRHSLVSFVNARLASLAAPDSSANVFADLIRPVLKAAGWSDADRSKARGSVAGMGWWNLHSASVEVVGADRHSDVVDWCRSAVSGTLQVGAHERAIAALGQNILDVDNQDEGEVADSLSQAVIANSEVLLIHPKTTLRYSAFSRPFNEMRDMIGGCPYFMLTNVIMAYNEYLLDRSAGLIDRIQQMVRKRGWADLQDKSDMEAAREDLDARVQLFEHQSLHVLPNIFRYPTERTMFDEIVRQRGLAQRAQGIERFTHNLYELRKDVIDLAERKGTRRTNGLLMALGIFQVSGLFLSALSLTELQGTGIGRIGVWLVFAASLAAGLLIAVLAFRDK